MILSRRCVIFSFPKVKLRGTQRLKHAWKIVQGKKNTINNIDRALNHYDDFYGPIYSSQWPSIRLALLSPHKYCAVVNNYSDTDRITTALENAGAMNMRTLFELQCEKLRYHDVNEVPIIDDGEHVYKMDKHLRSLEERKHKEELMSLYNSSGLEAPVSEMTFSNDDRLILPTTMSLSGLYEFVPATKLKGMEDWVPESKHYSYYDQSSNFPVRKQVETTMRFPEHLLSYMFEEGNITSFRQPKKGTTGVRDYFLLDGSSLLPVLALGLEPGDRMLDMCAAPGGKSMVALQTLYPELLVCNDASLSRSSRMKLMFQDFLFGSNKNVFTTNERGEAIEDYDAYNKILVDVPCTNDRHSVAVADNSLFNPMRTKERLQLPELQSVLLVSALKLVCVGGTVVYSTCSLSPIQNDGVVHLALQKIWQDTNIEIEVRDLTTALEPLKTMYLFWDSDGLKYGNIVLPYLPANFGPTYFCKLVRIA